MNDAKLRGISSGGGWDQFHGLVLTAHLAPVNLRTDPIDELAKGVARNKKIEAAKAKTVASYDNVLDSGSNAEQDRLSQEFLAQFQLSPPTSAHEFARDWKRMATTVEAD